MSKKFDSLGDRMKAYEQCSCHLLPRRSPVIVRIDGKAFHSFTRGFEKPFDDLMQKAMQRTMKYLCENVQGCVLGYTQSDEISLLLVDYYKIDTQPWFGNKLQKMCSVAASMATMAFNRVFTSLVDIWKSTEFSEGLPPFASEEIVKAQARRASAYICSREKAMFDARAFVIPKDEVCNYFIWRQQDAIRNSIEAVGQANFSHNQLQHKNCSMIKTMLAEEKGIIWEALSIDLQRGSCCVKRPALCSSPNKETFIRDKWTIDKEIPVFTDNRDYIEDIVYAGQMVKE